jgi:hypothetical protein
MEIMTIRGVERILVVIAGGITVYLGYRLFLNIPHQSDSQGKVVLPGGISIYMTRIGPGAFFALFGAIVVALSFCFPTTYDESVSMRKGANKAPLVPSSEDTVITKETHSSGLTPTLSERELENQMYFVNVTLPTLLRAELPETKRNELEVFVPKLKLCLLRSAWRDDWGRFDDFQAWFEQGSKVPPPKTISQGVAYFNHGKR